MRPIFDDRAFIEWIGRQKPDAKYTYDCCDNCLIARYLKYRGFNSVAVGKIDVLVGSDVYDQRRHRLPERWNEVAAGRGKTYGAAYARALELLG